ncbi:MAG: hypothetical protein SH817_06240 [Leptospira sp.]|nr:hypothetical protein [Leptospira sp.]
MKLFFSFPYVLVLSLLVINFWVCSFAHREKTEGPFRLGESIIRYGEELERNEKSSPIIFGQSDTSGTLL